jgi:PAS domain S-box-containing protein
MNQSRERVLVALARDQVTNTRTGLLKLTQTACELLDVDRAGVWWYREEKASLQCLDLFDCQSNSHQQGFTWSAQPNSDYFAWLARERWVAVADVNQEPALRSMLDGSYAQQFPIGAVLDIPIQTEAGFTGILGLERSYAHQWNPEEISLAVGLGDIVAISFERLLRKQAQEALVTRERRNRELLRQSSDVAYIIDPVGNILFAGSGLDRLLGYRSEAHVAGKFNIFTPVHPDDVALAKSSLANLLVHPQEACFFEARVRSRSGEYRWLEVRARNLSNLPEIGGVVVNARDITERKLLEDSLSNLAFFDSATKLPNRHRLLQDGQAPLAEANSRGLPLVIGVLGLTRLHTLAGGLGLEAIEQLFSQAAARLHCSAFTLYRIGDDSLALLFAPGTTLAGAAELAPKLFTSLEDVFIVGEHRIHLSASLGLASFPDNGNNVNELLDHAVAARYRAEKQSVPVHVYGPGAVLFTPEQIRLEDDLRQALNRGELRLEFQPIFDLITGRMSAAEALVRWDHPTRGIVSPGGFIPLAEEIRFINQVDYWVLQEALKEARRWWELGLDLVMNVNVSGHTLTTPGLDSLVKTEIQRQGLAPGQLCLEVTETALLHDLRQIGETIRWLGEYGALSAVDDFGAGYASLAYLRQLPVHLLKVDSQYVAGIGVDTRDEHLILAMTLLGHDLGIKVLAEGVETQAQLEWLAETGCDLVQGYLLSQPLDPDELVELARAYSATSRPN